MNSPRKRTIATISASLLVGMGGGVGASLAVDEGTSTTRVISAQGATLTPAASTSAGLTVNGIYRRAKQGAVDIVVATGSGRAEGSGLVIDKRGDIVTNQHVVDGARSLEVRFADGTRAQARVVGADASSDLAVIRVSGVDSSKLQPLTFGDSSAAQVGEGVVAIGSPYGLSGSLTVGVISALDRSIQSPNHYTIAGAIQTDAPINHGNSGGPLLDRNGRVIGVNSQIESGSGDNSGVGFAIPSSTVQKVVRQILAGDSVQHAFLGLSLGDAGAGSGGGAQVSAVTSGSPAASAGVRVGDVVTAVDGTALAGADDLVSAVQAHSPGDALTLTVRSGGNEHSVRVTLADRPSTAS
jgi:putative serine protease PepD